MTQLTPTMLTTASGRGVDLLDPKPEDIDFNDIAEQLAKENRFNGATPDVAYSVAQHLVVGCDAILGAALDLADEDDGRREVAGYFLLHDAPEAYLKDDTTPKKRALAALAAAEFGVLSTSVIQTFDALTSRWEVATAKAAGLAWPPPEHIAAEVKAMDRRMLATEWRDLMPRVLMPPGYDDAELLVPIIRPWPWEVARAMLIGRFRDLLPGARR